MDPSTTVLIASALVVFFAYFVFGMTGFGSSLLAVPILAHMFPLQAVVPLMTLMDFTAALFVGHGARRHVNWKEMKWLLPSFVVGVAAGVTLLINLPREPLLVGLGIVTVAFGVLSALDLGNGTVVHRGWAIPSGIAGGTFSASFGTGGPAFAIYFSRRIHDGSELRATMSAMIVISTMLRLALFVATGLLLDPRLFLLALMLAPITVLGLKLGSRVHRRMATNRLRRVFGAVLILSGISVLARAIA